MFEDLRSFYKVDSIQPKVCVVGMGYVGLTLAVSLCNVGFEVVGIDSNKEVVESLRNGKTNILEPELEESLNAGLESTFLKVVDSENIQDHLSNVKIFIITVGTPIVDRKINSANILKAIETIKPFLEEFSLIVIRSTVSIGTTRQIIYEPLLKQGYNILVSMCPERTVEGNALVEIRELPQIIGGVNDMSSHVSKLFFSAVSREIIIVENSESAELIKLINNTYRDLMFGFANEIAEISLSFGLNSREIIASANQNYARSNIALPGPSGGPCLEKDPWILYESAASNGVEANITKSARELNENVVVGFLKASLGEATNIHKVAILGLAFKGKPKTRDTRGSYVREVCSFLRRSGVGLITGFEPAGAVIDLDDVLDESFDLITAIKDADLIILLTNSEDFLRIENLISDSAAENAIVVDFWGAINQKSLRTDVSLKSWG